MELIIQILIVFIIINCILKLSFWKPWQTLVFGVICAAFIIWACQYAVLQSKTQIADYLNNKKILEDMAVLITIESAICFGFCFAALQDLFGKKRKKWAKPLYWYPGILIFPVLFYCLTQLIFGHPGTDFSTISYILAGVTVVVLPLSSWLMRCLFAEKDLRLEVYFLVSLFVSILGLLTTVNGNVVYAAAEEPINFKAVGLSFTLFAIAFVAGFMWNRLKWILLQRKKENTTKNNQTR